MCPAHCHAGGRWTHAERVCTARLHGALARMFDGVYRSNPSFMYLTLSLPIQAGRDLTQIHGTVSPRASRLPSQSRGPERMDGWTGHAAELAWHMGGGPCPSSFPIRTTRMQPDRGTRFMLRHDPTPVSIGPAPPAATRVERTRREGVCSRPTRPCVLSHFDDAAPRSPRDV